MNHHKALESMKGSIGLGTDNSTSILIIAFVKGLNKRGELYDLQVQFVVWEHYNTLHNNYNDTAVARK